MDSLFHFLEINQPLLSASASAGFGLCFFFWGIRIFVRRSFPGRASSLTVAAAEPGLATVCGAATGSRTLLAPITGQQCFAYRTTVWQRQGRKKDWKNVAEETGYLSFFIQDSTGEISVEPGGATLDLRPNFSTEYEASSTSKDDRPGATVPESVTAFLARNGIDPGQPMRIEERFLLPETPVTVRGTLIEDSGERHGSGRSAPEAPSAGQSSTQRLATSPTLAVPAPQPEVVRLSSGPLPTSTTHMTQQAKIAAALSRAGVAPPDMWTAPEILQQTNKAIATGEKVPGSNPVSQINAETMSPSRQDQPSTAPAAPTRLTFVKGNHASSFVISNRDVLDQPKVSWRSVALVVAGSSLAVLGLYTLLLAHALHWGR